jgi:phosphatidate cytidylyltransferase
MPNQLYLILAGIAVVLTLATAGTQVLRVSVRGFSSIAVLENLNARINAWWWIVLVLAAALLTGRIALIILFAAISFIALREFLTLTAVQPADRCTVLLCYLIILPAQYLLVASGRFELFVGSIPLATLLIVPALTALSGSPRNFLARAAELFLSVVICVYCISHIPALLMLPLPGESSRPILLMLFLILITQISDVLQYVWGKLFGRTRVAPHISPAKTLEGLVGGVLSASLLGAGLWWMTPFSPLQAGCLAFLVCVAGFLGGLVVSAVKRDRGIKDWSGLIPGHGGVLDRMDSLILSAPLFFHVVRIAEGSEHLTVGTGLFR